MEPYPEMTAEEMAAVKRTAEHMAIASMAKEMFIAWGCSDSMHGDARASADKALDFAKIFIEATQDYAERNNISRASSLVAEEREAMQ